MTSTTRLYATFTPYIMALLGTTGSARSINWTYYRTKARLWLASKLRGAADTLAPLPVAEVAKVDTAHESVEETVTVTVLPTTDPTPAPVVLTLAPVVKPLADMTKAELLKLGEERGVPLKKGWLKAKLIDALRLAEAA